MKKPTSSAPIIVIEWSGQTVSAQAYHNMAALEELAGELGRLAARRDLAAARARKAEPCPGSVEKIRQTFA